MKNISNGLALSLILCGTLNAEIFDNHQMGVNVGTLGAGIEYSTSINDIFALRTGFNKFDYSESLTESGIKYDADLQLQTISLILDYHPFSNGFRLSTGAMYNGNELKVKGKPDGGTIEINDVIYTSADVGQLDGSVDFNEIAPYVGIGYSSSKTKSTGFSFNTEIGAMFQGSPSVKLNGDCGAGLTALQCQDLKSDLSAEEKQLSDELNEFKIYPVLSLGLGYKF